MSLTFLNSLERNTLLQPVFSQRDSWSLRPFAKDMAALWPEGEQGPVASRWKSLACEPCAEIFSQNLLDLASKLESCGEVQVAWKLFGYLSRDKRFPEEVRHRAQTQLNLWQGQGSLANRASHWLRFLPQELSRGEAAAGLILGAGGFNFGLRLGQRFFAGAGIIQKSLGASAMGLLGEASAMSLGYGAVQTYHGEKADFGGLWTHSLAMSGAYRGMGFLLGRLAHLPLPAPLSQAWRQSSPLLRQEAGKFTGVLGVEALMQGSPLNLGGASSSGDILFNSVTTYFNLGLYHGLYSVAAPGRNPLQITTLKNVNLQQLGKKFFSQAPRAFFVLRNTPLVQLAGGRPIRVGMKNLPNLFPPPCSKIKGPVLNYAEGIEGALRDPLAGSVGGRKRPQLLGIRSHREEYLKKERVWLQTSQSDVVIAPNIVEIDNISGLLEALRVVSTKGPRSEMVKTLTQRLKDHEAINLRIKDPTEYGARESEIQDAFNFATLSQKLQTRFRIIRLFSPAKDKEGLPSSSLGQGETPFLVLVKKAGGLRFEILEAK